MTDREIDVLNDGLRNVFWSFELAGEELSSIATSCAPDTSTVKWQWLSRQLRSMLHLLVTDRQIDMLDCGLSDVYWFPKPVGDEL